MPVHKTSGGGYQWGNHGKIYYGKSAKKKAGRQGAAAHAAGYKGSVQNACKSKKVIRKVGNK